jgi:hypothetical protein
MKKFPEKNKRKCLEVSAAAPQGVSGRGVSGIGRWGDTYLWVTAIINIWLYM